MSIDRPASTVKCSECGIKAEQHIGANNWVMCDTCLTTYCSDCYRSVKQSSTSCTGHNPWGKWLWSGGTYGNMTFSR